MKENPATIENEIEYQLNANPNNVGLADSCFLEYTLNTDNSTNFDVIWNSEYGEIKQKYKNTYWLPPNDTGYFVIYFNLIYQDSLLFHDSTIVRVFDHEQLSLDAIQKLTQVNYNNVAN